ncbi:hypothetical protein [Streptomyces sp. NBC_01373]|uniref:hypothetical protein n=1 Tax=Streptomyces sp. NBC_01373 TaxID=2903843 RepID=UPI00224D73FC|nr:hypothetical protein [Streptomyces sp. NBC_01373]MCX4702737.1 hypothetical protein [Streptomyces sp. NBC_01373]
MTGDTEHRIDMTATVVSLATEATELETRVNELRQELVDLNERIEAISDALHQLPTNSAVVSNAAVSSEL